MKTVDFLRDILHIEDEKLIREALKLCEVKVVRKGEHLIRQGQQPTMLWFLVEGIFRGFLSGINGKDITDCIVDRSGRPLMPNPDIWAPAHIGIEALTDSTVLNIALKDFEHLLTRFPVLNTMYRDFLLWSSNMHWELKVIVYQYTALQRYHWFLKTHPGLIDKISHKHIASYLNMSPVTLSRLIHMADGAPQAEGPLPEGSTLS